MDNEIWVCGWAFDKKRVYLRKPISKGCIGGLMNG